MARKIATAADGAAVLKALATPAKAPAKVAAKTPAKKPAAKAAPKGEKPQSVGTAAAKRPSPPAPPRVAHPRVPVAKSVRISPLVARVAE